MLGCFVWLAATTQLYRLPSERVARSVLSQKFNGVRPLGHMGKLQLAKDMAELQLAVGSSLYPLEQLGQPYRWVDTHARAH
eukprot:scaffold219848_cov18-Tisochrysis_lutea.AAC.1